MEKNRYNMRTKDMKYSQGYFTHEDEVRGIHVSMGNAKTKSNGLRS